MSIRIAVVEDQDLVLRGICELLQDEPDFEIVRAYFDGPALLAALPRISPHVVVMDVRMPGLSGVQTLSRMRNEGVDVPPAAPVDVPKMSDREQEVLRLMAGGYSNREIARALFLAEGTVKNYVSEILAKLECRDRTRAVLKAITLHLV